MMSLDECMQARITHTHSFYLGIDDCSLNNVRKQIALTKGVTGLQDNFPNQQKEKLFCKSIF